jgi:mannan endo-1,4-beta-mannosidase
MTAPPPAPVPPRRPRPDRRSIWGMRAVFLLCVVVGVAVVTAGVLKEAARTTRARPSAASSTLPIGTFSHHPVVIALPARPASYLGVFARGVPKSYAPIASLARATGVQPNIALYYSGWRERFQFAFALQATANGAVPFIQIDPEHVDLAAIDTGAYDTYLETFATDVASYGARTGHGVIIGFGHEVNGYWYSWGYRHTSPALFVAAWRHIVTVFRQQGADDVTWLWTINVIDRRGGIPPPDPWWPGSSYVTWVGIDGYYLKPSWTFAPLFGPTIKAVRKLTLDPILISETAAGPAAGQPAKIANLFAGVRAYGLLGFVWFDANAHQDFRLTSQAARAAFSRGARAYDRPGS